MTELTHANVSQLNYEYLVQFREVWAKSQAEACLRFRIPTDLGERIANYSHQQLKAIAARARMVVCIQAEDLPSVQH